MGDDARMRSSSLRLVLASALASSLGGCSLFYDPCGDLEARLCSDLGADCATFRSDAQIHGSVIPQRRRSAERQQCEMFGADENYASYTLPYVRYQVQARRDPTVRMPALPTPRPAGLSSGFASWLYCALPFVVIPAMLFYTWYARRQLAAASGAPAGAMPHAGPPPGAWDHVDSREKAEALARSGALVAVELVPGMPAVPENVVYLPPHAAARMRALAAEGAQLAQSGHPVHFVAEPQYRGRSFVPASVVVRFGDRAETVHAW